MTDALQFVMEEVHLYVQVAYGSVLNFHATIPPDLHIYWTRLTDIPQ